MFKTIQVFVPVLYIWGRICPFHQLGPGLMEEHETMLNDSLKELLRLKNKTKQNNNKNNKKQKQHKESHVFKTHYGT